MSHPPDVRRSQTTQNARMRHLPDVRRPLDGIARCAAFPDGKRRFAGSPGDKTPQSARMWHPPDVRRSLDGIARCAVVVPRCRIKA